MSSGSSSSSSFRDHVARLARAAETVAAETASAPQTVAVQLNEAAASLPPHIIAATDPVKLNKQAPIFRCPVWAGLPSRPFHLHCTRDQVPFPALGLERFPYYLFGKNPVCDYVLEHPSVSSVHAALIFNKEHACFVLLDLGSTNGVRLHGARVEPRKPIPIAVGAVMQFGYSTRTYELRAGAAPSLKRAREDDGCALPAKASSSSTTAAGPDPSPADAAPAAARVAAATAPSPSHPARATAPSPGPSTSGTAAEAVAVDAQAAPPAATPAAAAAVAEPLAPIHLFQLVVKHKDVDNPVSRGHNKGEVITRSRADALDVVRYIVEDHQRRVPVDAALGFSPWTVEEFVAAVGEYCEVSTKKKRGDLGVVEKGTFADEIDEAAFRLRRGEVSAPVETQLGVHIFYRCD